KMVRGQPRLQRNVPCHRILAPDWHCAGNAVNLRPVFARKRIEETAMAKAYWVATYRSISNPEALAEYAKLAAPAIQAGGGRFLARGNPSKVYEAGINQRVVIIEFDSVTQAVATHDGAGYQAALAKLKGG